MSTSGGVGAELQRRRGGRRRPSTAIPDAPGSGSAAAGSEKLVAYGRSYSCSSRWWRCPVVLGTRRRKELGTAVGCSAPSRGKAGGCGMEKVFVQRVRGDV